ncbi:MAG: 4-hydroxy-tetrahydrodipicolinate reductase [Clostridia bacterium]|nr:4-hydroxy-tetrahydrodipicolinate reductase [Clostridia bacterium]
MKVIIHGASGRMGNAVYTALCKENDVTGIAFVDKFMPDYPLGLPQKVTETALELTLLKEDYDVLVDFSNHVTTLPVTNFAIDKKIPTVICTTGQTEDELTLIKQASKKTAIFYSGNMSVGVAVLGNAVKNAVLAMKDAEIEIIETHHDKKLDAPSGTALMLADFVKEARPEMTVLTGRNGFMKKQKDEIGISSIRYGSIVGIHEVIISTDTETLSFKHQAHTRAVFADGAVAAVKYLFNKSAGLYDMKMLLSGK